MTVAPYPIHPYPTRPISHSSLYPIHPHIPFIPLSLAFGMGLVRTMLFIGLLLFTIQLLTVYSIDDDLHSESFGLSFNTDDRLAEPSILHSDCPEDVLTTLHTVNSTLSIVHLRPDLKNFFYETDLFTGECTAVCLVPGTKRSLLQHPLPERIFRSTDHRGNSTATAVSAWLWESCLRAEVGFVNQGSEDAEIYWISSSGMSSPSNEEGSRVFSGDLLPGERNTRWLQSFLGHAFVVLSSSSKAELAAFTVRHDSFFVVGTPPPIAVPLPFLDSLEERVEVTLESEWEKSRRVTRTFTGLGFAKGRLPLDLYSSMSAHHYNNRHHLMREEWQNKGLFVNWWERDAHMIGMPWELKRYWQTRLKTLVEAWAGIPLELTDIYGMRQYGEGARLLMHVDRINTHAASLIINVAQEGVNSSWPLQIYDFADRLHEVLMAPGDIVYYESARCLHDRMTPFNGTAFVNLFAHYRPLLEGSADTGDPDWYSRPNPPGTPAPILSEQSVCAVDATQAGSFESCGSTTATGGQDLFQLWLSKM